MADEINLTIANPMEIVLNTTVGRVMLPSVDGYITILPDRAPMTMLLENGLMQLLDKDGKVTARYFIRRGLANIADNNCLVSTEDLIKAEDISLEQAKDAAENMPWPMQREFYARVAEILNVKAMK